MDASRRSAESTPKSLRSGRSAGNVTLGTAVVKVECVDNSLTSGSGVPIIIDLKREVVVQQDVEEGEAINAEIEKDLEFSASTPNPEVKGDVAACGNASMANAPFSPVLPAPSDQIEVVEDCETVDADEGAEDAVDDLENIQAFLDYIEDPEKKNSGSGKSDKFAFKEVYLTPLENVPAPGAPVIPIPLSCGPEAATSAPGKFRKRVQKRPQIRLPYPSPVPMSGNPFLPGHVGPFTPPQMTRPMGYRNPFGPFVGPRLPMGSSGGYNPFSQNVWDFQRSYVSGQTLMYTTPKSSSTYVDSPTARHQFPVSNACVYDSSKSVRPMGVYNRPAPTQLRPRFPAPSSTVTSKDAVETITSDLERPKRQGSDEAEKSPPKLQIDSKPNSPSSSKVDPEETTEAVCPETPKDSPTTSSGNRSSGYMSGIEDSKRSGSGTMPTKDQLVYQHLYNHQPLLGSGNLPQWPPHAAYYYQSNSYTGNITSNTINISAQEPKAATMFSASALPQFVVNQQQQYFNSYYPPPPVPPPPRQYYYGNYGPEIGEPVQPNHCQMLPPQPVVSTTHFQLPASRETTTTGLATTSSITSASRQNVEVKSNFEEITPFANYNDAKSDFADVFEGVANNSIATVAATSPTPSVGLFMEEFGAQQGEPSGNGDEIDFAVPAECINQIQGVSNSDGYGHVEVVDSQTYAGNDALSTVVQMSALPTHTNHQVIVDQSGQHIQITGDIQDQPQYVGIVGANPNNPMSMRVLTSQDIKPVMLPPPGNYQLHHPNKKPRTIFSDAQCSKMKEVFRHTPYITRQMRAELAKSLDISQDTISVWFKNQRSKLKKQFNVQKEAEGWS